MANTRRRGTARAVAVAAVFGAISATAAHQTVATHHSLQTLQEDTDSYAFRVLSGASRRLREAGGDPGAGGEEFVPEAPVEEAPVEPPPEEFTPLIEAPVEEAPVEEAPVEEAPVEEAPVEEAPVEPEPETPAEEEPLPEDPAAGEEDPAAVEPAEELPEEEEPAAPAKPAAAPAPPPPRAPRAPAADADADAGIAPTPLASPRALPGSADDDEDEDYTSNNALGPVGSTIGGLGFSGLPEADPTPIPVSDEYFTFDYEEVSAAAPIAANTSTPDGGRLVDADAPSGTGTGFDEYDDVGPDFDAISQTVISPTSSAHALTACISAVLAAAAAGVLMQ